MRARIAILAAIGAAWALTAVLPAGAQDDAEGAAREWVLNDDFVVEVDGAPAPDARLYRSRGRATLLFVEPSLPSPLMFNPRSRTYSPVDGGRLRPDGDRSVVLPDMAIGAEEHTYEMDGAAVVLTWKGRRIKIATKPPLIGETTMEEIFRHSPIYRDGMDRYEPGAEDVTWLREFAEPVRVEVFFGTWCPHCKEMVPKLLKCLSVASNARIALDLKGVPQPPFSAYPPARERGIRGVPTFIIYAGGREIGRFSGVPDNSSIEHELVKILAAWKAVSG